MVDLAHPKFANGTVLEAEAFQAANDNCLLTDYENAPVPVGDYTMAARQILLVSEEGIIGDIKSA